MVGTSQHETKLLKTKRHAKYFRLHFFKVKRNLSKIKMMKELKATILAETLPASGQYSYNSLQLVSLPLLSSSFQPITHTAPKLVSTKSQFLIHPNGFQ